MPKSAFRATKIVQYPLYSPIRLGRHADLQQDRACQRLILR